MAKGCVLQDWVIALPMMQQTLLISAVRGPDGCNKEGPHKQLLRWYRRCVLKSAMDGVVLPRPYTPGGGSFTGPSMRPPATGWEPTGPGEPVPTSMLKALVKEYLANVDRMPLHFHLHFMHAVGVLGYKHPDPWSRKLWNWCYRAMVIDMHLHPETEEEMDRRMGDTVEGWRDAQHVED